MVTTCAPYGAPTHTDCTIAAHGNQLSEVGAKRGGCPSWAVVRRPCGCIQHIPIPCHDPLCVPCQKLWAWQVRQRWEPVVKKMRAPKVITLTVRNSDDLAECWESLSVGLRRLFDTRVGSRNWPKFEQAALADLVESQPDLAARKKVEKSLEWFGQRIQTFHGKNGHWPRVRDMLGEGFLSPEVTVSFETGWHPHRHMVADSWFIPQVLLKVLWQNATKGRGRIVDIRALGRDEKSMREAIKYVTKPWEIPEDKADELRRVLFGKKRIWPFGGAKPVVPESTCPGCGQPTDQCKPIDISIADTIFFDGERGLAVIQGRHNGIRRTIQRIDGRWQEPEYLNLILMPFAWHSQVTRAGPDPPD